MSKKTKQVVEDYTKRRTHTRQPPESLPPDIRIKSENSPNESANKVANMKGCYEDCSRKIVFKFVTGISKAEYRVLVTGGAFDFGYTPIGHTVIAISDESKALFNDFLSQYQEWSRQYDEWMAPHSLIIEELGNKLKEI